MCMCVYIYIYIYVHTHIEREREMYICMYSGSQRRMQLVARTGMLRAGLAGVEDIYIYIYIDR